jgi:hypothetical protein
MEVRHGSRVRPNGVTQNHYPPASTAGGDGGGPYRPRAWTRADVEDCMDIFEPLFEDHLDRFCSLHEDGARMDERMHFASLLEHHRDDLEMIVWWCSSRLIASPFGPREVFPGRLCKRLANEVQRPSSAVMLQLMNSVRQTDAPRWDAVVEILAQLAVQTKAWTMWPSDSITCERAAALLDALAEPWSAAVEQLRANSRAFERKDAFRRAQHWRHAMAKNLHTLALPRGALRLLHEYIHHVCTQFHESCPKRDVGTYELFMLEVVNYVVQLWNVEPSDEPRPPRPLEQQHARRRKRIERARLRAFFGSELPSSLSPEAFELTLVTLAECD